MSIRRQRLIVIDKFIKELSKKLNRSEKDIVENGLTVYDFQGEVVLTYEDGSCIHYRNAFMVSNSTEIGVFTEHCEYHIYDIKQFESYQNFLT